MFKNNLLFTGCLIVSLGIHSAILSGTAKKPKEIQISARKKSIEVFYVKREPGRGQKTPSSVLQKSRAPRKAVQTPLDSKIPLPPKEKVPLPEFPRQSIFNKDAPVEKKKSDSDNQIPQKMVVMPDIPSETAKSPEYKSYYQLIREKIRRFSYYNYHKLEEGEVLVSFILDPQGGVIDAAIDAKKSSPSPYLRETALKSVKEASPYPAFPEKLKKNKTLSFNVVISFELR